MAWEDNGRSFDQHPAYPAEQAVAPQGYTPQYPTQWSGQSTPAGPPPQPGATVQPYAPPQPAIPHPGFASSYPAAEARPRVSAGGRLVAVLLDILLAVVTLWIGWFVWALFTWSDGQSPGKRLMGFVVTDEKTGEPFDFGRMVLREFCVKALLGTLFSMITFGVYFWVNALMILGDGQRTLHDRMAGSVVRHL
ncbi:RDD family protein [Actinoplanes sp. DH11]|uniref:RDD family protein n=1 Tax=Actinoplanes sp. DH11 TaxID=2857011 RepID=UPI001E5312FF|nr:RDD family protein [Actinoplanes sp. DH11]